MLTWEQMPIWSLTQERLDRLKDQIRKKKEEHDALEALSEKDLWCRDLDEFVEEWENQLRLDAEIQTNIRRMGRRVSKKIGAGKGRRAREDDEYAPEKKTKAVKGKAAVAPKVETKTHQRFAEMFTARPKPKVEKSDDDMAIGGFSDDDFAALGRKSQPAKTTEVAAPAEDGGRVRRAAAAKPKTWILSDDDMSFADDDKMLGDVGAMVKGIGQPAEDKAHGRLSLFAMSRPDSQSASNGTSALPKVKPKPSKTFDFDSHDDTNYEMLVKSSPQKTAAKGDDIDDLLSDDDLPPPKISTMTKTSTLASGTSKAALGVVPAKKRGRPAGAKSKPKDDEAPKAKAKAAAGAKAPALSPAAKAYAAKKGTKKSAYSDDEDEDEDVIMEDSPPPRPAARGRPGRAATAKAKPKYVVDDDEDDSMAGGNDDSDDPFSMDSE